MTQQRSWNSKEDFKLALLQEGRGKVVGSKNIPNSYNYRKHKTTLANFVQKLHEINKQEGNFRSYFVFREVYLKPSVFWRKNHPYKCMADKNVWRDNENEFRRILETWLKDLETELLLDDSLEEKERIVFSFLIIRPYQISPSKSEKRLIARVLGSLKKPLDPSKMTPVKSAFLEGSKNQKDMLQTCPSDFDLDYFAEDRKEEESFP